MKFGLKDSTRLQLVGIFQAHPKIESVTLYGSRAKGNYRPGSDIDLTFHGAELTLRELNIIEQEIDDLLLPYEFDLSLFEQIDNQNLLAHITRAGKCFYQAEGE